jgi:hypothetical protein
MLLNILLFAGDYERDAAQEQRKPIRYKSEE